MNTAPVDLHADRRDSTSRATPWGLLDIFLAVAAGVVLGIVLSYAAFFVLRQLGLRPSNSARVTLLAAAVYGGLFLGVWLLIVARLKLPWSAVGFRPVGPGVVSTVLAALVGLTIANIVVLAVMGLFLGPIQNPQEESFAPGGFLSLSGYLWLLPAVSVFAPIVEELVFRGLLYPYLRGRMSVPLAVVLSAALFAVAHVYPIIMPPLFLAGVVLALLAQRYRSIIPTILLHALFNGVQITLLYLASNVAR